jgi:hypothetical protein
MKALCFLVILSLIVASTTSLPIVKRDNAISSDGVDGHVSRNEVASFLVVIKDVIFEKLFGDKPTNSAVKITSMVYPSVILATINIIIFV